jgi:twitching motility protein PilT
MPLNQDDLLALLRELVDTDATELHLKVPARPLLRQDGRLLPLQRSALTPEDTQRLATLLLGLARVEVPLATVHHREFSFGVPRLGRFHASVYRQRGSLALRFARIAFRAPTLEELGLDAGVESSLAEPGLVLVCGGSRRAGALASLVDRFNSTHRGFVVVLEDPLTHLHRDGTATIVQRGLGTDVDSFPCGIRAAIRQGADLLAVGDVPDRATAEGLLCAAEQGMTVVACVAAPEPGLAASWLLRHFESDRDADVKSRIKRLLTTVVCVPRTGESQVVHRRRSLELAS